MNILHIVEDFSVKSGGLRTVVKDLDFYLKEMGHQSYILTSDKEKDDAIFTIKTNNKWLYSKKWKSLLIKIIEEKKIEIIHIHGVWLYPQLMGAKIAAKKNIPMILSLHGMFQPWLWKKGTLKKKIYFYGLSKKWFSKAKAIQTITQNENENLKTFFPKVPFFEIPNLIAIKKDKKNKNVPAKNILFLGRLNKTKGIDILIKAFSEINPKDFTMQIAGDGPYRNELEALVHSLKLDKKVYFLGMVKGQQKESLIENAWVMVSPTYSDVIGMVNLEAAAKKTPVITTYNTGLLSDWNINGGMLINPNIKELTNALKKAINWVEEERKQNGELLHNFVKENYAWNTQMYKWENAYKNALKNE